MDLKSWRDKYGFSQRELAKLLNCDVSTYSKYENGHLKMSIDDAAVLAQYYHVSLDNFVQYDNKQINLIDVAAALAKEEGSKVISDYEWQMIYASRDADTRSQTDALTLLRSHPKDEQA